MRTYSYDPSKTDRKGMDKMRLELGDTTLAPGELTAALCDEEYNAIISQHSSWKKAKLKCLQQLQHPLPVCYQTKKRQKTP